MINLLKKNNRLQFNKSGFWGVFVIRLIAYFIFILLLSIIIFLYYNGSGIISSSFLFSSPVNNGIGIALFGTIAVCLIMIILSVPIGVLSAIYLVEYAENTILKRIIKISIHNLAGVPAIVFGLFGLGFFVLILGKNIDEVLKTGLLFGQPSMLWAGATLAILVLPTIIVSAMEALERIPLSQREAAYALGAERWQVIRKVVLPQAAPGILTGVILSISRGMGEVAPVLFLGCAFFIPDLPIAYLNFGLFGIPLINPAEQFMYLAYNVFILSTQSLDIKATLPYLYGNVVVLITLVMLFNSAAIYYRYKFRKILQSINKN
jgi:phosphate transport system permease protein